MRLIGVFGNVMDADGQFFDSGRHRRGGRRLFLDSTGQLFGSTGNLLHGDDQLIGGLADLLNHLAQAILHTIKGFRQFIVTAGVDHSVQLAIGNCRCGINGQLQARRGAAPQYSGKDHRKNSRGQAAAHQNHDRKPLGIGHFLTALNQQLLLSTADFSEQSTHAVHLGFVGPRGDACIQLIIRHIACSQIAAQGDDRIDIFIEPALLGITQSGQAALLLRIVSCQALERIEFFVETPLPRHQWLQERILRSDDKASHPGLDIDQLFKGKLRFAQHLIRMNIAVCSLFDLLETSVSTRDKDDDKHDDRGKAEVKLLRDAEFAEHDVGPELAIPWLAWWALSLVKMG